jgi:hypothetical protein
VKTVFLTIIALIIPLFFVLIVVMSTYHRLAALRDRCRRSLAAVTTLKERRASLAANSDQDARDLEVKRLDQELASTLQSYNDLALEYHQACRRFPVNLVAGVLGLSPMERISPEPSRNSSDQPRRDTNEHE